MKKRFIVLIDFSDESANLLRYAYDWSRHINAELLLLHQIDFVVSARVEDVTRDLMEEQSLSIAVDRLKQFSRDVLPDTDNIRCMATPYNLMSQVSELLNDPYENLIFVGVKGTAFIKKIIFGSVAVKVIEQSKLPVVAMHKDVTAFSPEKIMIAVSEEFPLSIPTLNNVLGFFGDVRPSLNFFTIAHPNEDSVNMEKQLNELASLFAENCPTSVAVYRSENSFGEIKKIINNTTKELLIVQRGSRLLIDQLFRKFLVNELIYEGKTPLIVLP